MNPKEPVKLKPAFDRISARYIGDRAPEQVNIPDFMVRIFKG
jgi:hypothetical protein